MRIRKALRSFTASIVILIFSYGAGANTKGWSNTAQVTDFWCQMAKSCFVSGNFGNPGSCPQTNVLLIDEKTLWGALEDNVGNGGFYFVMSMVMKSQVNNLKFRCWVDGCQSAQGTAYNKCVQPALIN